jgi:hypothetical protein
MGERAQDVMGNVAGDEGRAAPAAKPSTPAADPAAQPDALAVLQRESTAKDELIRQLLTRAPAQSDDRAAPQVPQKPGPPPDAIRDPDGFQKWARQVADYNEAVVRHAVTEGRAEVNESLRRDRLWGTFQQRFPDLASDPDLCGYAFQAELERAGGRLPADEGRFLDAIGARLRAFRGGAAAGEKPKPAAGRAAHTAGVSAGSGANADEARVVDPATGRTATGEKPKPFATQLEEIRSKRNPDLFG